MRTFSKTLRISMLTAALAGSVLATGCSMMGMDKGGMMMSSVTLSGAQEVPPVSTAATGKSTLSIASDRTVSGSVTVSEINATAAHIHEAAMGANGPVIVPFTKTGDMTFSPAAGAKLTDAQYASYLAGNLYVNVHSAANPGGEIRAQLRAK